MIKLLITNPSMKVGGVETALLYLLNNLDYTKYSVDLLLIEGGELLESIPKEVKVIYYHDYMLMPNKFLVGLKKNILVQSLYDTQRFAFKKRYDISIAFNGFNNYTDMVAASVKSKKKIIWVHNDFKEALKYKKAKFFYKFMWHFMSNKYKYFDNIVCVSNSVKDNFNSYFKGFKKKTLVIGNMVDGDFIRKQAKKKTTIKLDKSYNIVAIGRLIKSKQFDKIIKLTKELKNKKMDVKTYIIGDGKEFYSLSRKIRSLRLTDSVIMLGAMENPYNILTQADLLISMSLHEAFGNILLESMILDVPFLSNINSGSKDISKNIMPMNAGIICKNEDMLIQVLKMMRKYRKPISFNDKEYNKNIKKQINELFSIPEEVKEDKKDIKKSDDKKDTKSKTKKEDKVKEKKS